MARLKDVRPEDMPDLIREAQQEYEKDRRRRCDEHSREELADAAQELGLPVEYLERAAASYQNRLAARARWRQRFKGAMLFGGGAATGVAGALLLARPAPPPAAVEAPPPVQAVVAAPAMIAGTVLGDIDGDGWADVCVAGPDGTILYRRSGPGRYIVVPQ
jgi:hypothetical protein